jgi:hypothetical protein
VLSLFLWCLVDDDFIVRLSMGTILSRIHQWHFSAGSGEIPEHGVGAHAEGPSHCTDIVQRCWLVG